MFNVVRNMMTNELVESSPTNNIFQGLVGLQQCTKINPHEYDRIAVGYVILQFHSRIKEGSNS